MQLPNFVLKSRKRMKNTFLKSIDPSYPKITIKFIFFKIWMFSLTWINSLDNNFLILILHFKMKLGKSWKKEKQVKHPCNNNYYALLGIIKHNHVTRGWIGLNDRSENNSFKWSDQSEGMQFTILWGHLRCPLLSRKLYEISRHNDKQSYSLIKFRLNLV